VSASPLRTDPSPVAASAARPRTVEVLLHEKIVLDYNEVQALGICAERTLRRLVPKDERGSCGTRTRS